jgi:hypothetical protein
MELTIDGSRGVTIDLVRSSGAGADGVTITVGFADGARELRLTDAEARSLATAILVAAGA